MARKNRRRAMEAITDDYWGGERRARLFNDIVLNHLFDSEMFGCKPASMCDDFAAISHLGQAAFISHDPDLINTLAFELALYPYEQHLLSANGLTVLICSSRVVSVHPRDRLWAEIEDLPPFA